MNQIKTRLILEERTADSPEKLSTEFYMYKKEDIRRITGKRKRPRKEEEDELPPEALPDDIRDLLKE
jgi:hypothetical protein